METTLFIAALVFVLAGAFFIYLTLRDNERFVPRGGLQWATSIFSVLLIATGSLALVVLINPPEAPMPQPAGEDARVGEVAENFSFRLVEDDGAEALASFEGQPVLLNLWATWCGTCRSALPELNRLQETYADAGLVVLLISDEARETLQDFEREVALKTVSGYIDDPRDLPEPFRSVVRGRPLYYLIDGDGVIRYHNRGRLDVAEFERVVQPYLQSSVAMR